MVLALPLSSYLIEGHMPSLEDEDGEAFRQRGSEGATGRAASHDNEIELHGIVERSRILNEWVLVLPGRRADEVCVLEEGGREEDEEDVQRQCVRPGSPRHGS